MQRCRHTRKCSNTAAGQQAAHRSTDCSFRVSVSKMKLLNLFSGLLCASSALATGFKKPAKPTLPRSIVERRVANQPFSHPEIQKRASRFLTAKTEC